jgi:hypothetical protein
MVSFGIQIFILDLQMISSPAAGANLPSNTSNTFGPNSATAASSIIPFNLSQLALFMLAIGWSGVYVVMIYFEIRKYRGRWNSHLGQVEMGLLNRVD